MARSKTGLLTPSVRKRSSPGSTIRTHRRYGPWGSPGRTSLLPVRIPAFAGRITRSNLTIAGGTESRPITITIGMTPFTTAPGIRAVTIRRFPAMISFTAATRQEQRSATMGWATRSEWRLERSGLVAVTWMKATVHRPDTSSAWNSFLRLIPSIVHPARATLPRLPTLQLTRGVARLRKVVLLTPCKPLLKLKVLLASRW
jgi:hypothetical protein